MCGQRAQVMWFFFTPPFFLIYFGSMYGSMLQQWSPPKKPQMLHFIYMHSVFALLM